MQTVQFILEPWVYNGSIEETNDSDICLGVSI